jgi:hypothetical protein
VKNNLLKVDKEGSI